MEKFRHVKTWVFDMDGTLYDALAHIFPAMDANMTEYIVQTLGLTYEEAWQKREDYYENYGTTLRGLMTEHGTDPHHYTYHTHKNLDVMAVPQCPVTREKLGLLPGRKLVFTNAPLSWAKAILGRLDIGHHFDGIFAIEDAEFQPKPYPFAYDAFLTKFGVDPKTACMLEDSAKNLKPAHDLGMTTVWLHNGLDAHHPHVHHKAERLADWLAQTLENEKDTACRKNTGS